LKGNTKSVEINQTGDKNVWCQQIDHQTERGGLLSQNIWI